MKKLRSLPTWLVAMLIIRLHLLHGEHEWNNARFHLTDWSAHQTDLCKMFDYLFWVLLINSLVLVYLIANPTITN